MVENGKLLNNRYKLLTRAGAGGMAAVYKAQDLMLGRLVAVKLLHENLTGDDEFLTRFREEARAAARLAHPNIVTVHDIGQDEHRQFIIMEYIEGQTLKQIIRSQASLGTPMPIKRALDLTIQICSGIGYAHRAGLIHCDVKPQNVLVTRDQRVKVADFGIARAMSQASQQVESDTIWGTPQYFSPEQAAGQPATPASDVYSIGVILFEMLTGHLPFEAESHTALALKHIQEPPPPISHFNPAVPEQIERIVAKVLAKEASGRYRTADQLGRILNSYRQSSQEDTGPLATVRTPPAGHPAWETEPASVSRAAATQPKRAAAIERPSVIHIPPPEEEQTDWTAIGLGLLALVFLLGLIPLWYAVYLAWTG